MRNATIVFDLDGTLVDTAPDLIGATNHALASIGVAPVEGAALRPWISYGARRMVEEALAARGRILDSADVDRLHGIFLDYYERNIATESRPYSGAEAVLADLLEGGARLAICTNKREGLSLALLEALGLSARFAAVAGRDTFAVHKPHPDHLIGVIGLAGGEVSRAVMVGDSGVDVEAARNARVPVVGVTFGYTATPMSALGPDALISHYRELPAALARLLARP